VTEGAAAHPTTAYALAVVAGEIVAGRFVRLACERHLRDLESGAERGLYFDAGAALRVLKFFTGLRHSKGKWAGEPVFLELWQCFIVGCLFGWKRADGLRRFVTGYTEMARKNGKSTLAAGVALYLLVADDEPGAEVYCAATKRDQARIVFSEAARMVRRSPGLARRVRQLRDNLSIVATASKCEPLGADADSMDGLNPHGTIIDELHAHKSRKAWDLIETATGSREQPLTFAITTAGDSLVSVCREQHDYSVKVLEGAVDDDSWFAFVAQIDEADDWRDPAVWVKANPNLGVSMKPEYLARKVAQAIEVPGRQNPVKRLHLGRWTKQTALWLDMDVWAACAGDAAMAELMVELEGRECYGGLDLASKNDLAALALLFPPAAEGERWKLLVFFWCPEVGIERRARQDRAPYDVWAQQGYIAATEGDVVDYDAIRLQIAGDAPGPFGPPLAGRYTIREIAFDRWNATQLVTQLQGDGVIMVPFGQGFASMAAPTREFGEVLVAGRRLAHGANPVLSWMASHVAVKQDPAGNLKADRQRSSEKIDGLVATLMALGRATLREADEGPGVADTVGVLVI